MEILSWHLLLVLNLTKKTIKENKEVKAKKILRKSQPNFMLTSSMLRTLWFRKKMLFLYKTSIFSSILLKICIKLKFQRSHLGTIVFPFKAFCSTSAWKQAAPYWKMFLLSIQKSRIINNCHSKTSSLSFRLKPQVCTCIFQILTGGHFKGGLT